MPVPGPGVQGLLEWTPDMVELYSTCALRHNQLVETVEEHNSP